MGKTYTLTEITEKTLEWINEMREIRGMEPLSRIPDGIPGDCYACPVAEATGLVVGDRRWAFSHAEPDQGDLPEPVSTFIQAFDTGKFPEYEVDDPCQEELNV